MPDDRIRLEPKGGPVPSDTPALRRYFGRLEAARRLAAEAEADGERADGEDWPKEPQR